MLRRKKVLIVGLVIFIAIGFLAYQGFVGAATYYYTVSEVMEKGSSVYGESLRVKGQVEPGSIEEPGGLTMKFVISEGDKSLPVVVSKAAVPDTFNLNSEVTVEGSIDATGVFQAKSILTACPSRYVPAPAK